jgi:hypothetical protein
MTRLAIAVIVSITTGLLACGCMWGHVYDANTGHEVPGATVSWVDHFGRSGSMTTGLWWAPGLYAFCYELYTAPLDNPVTFTITAPGYMPLVEQRQVSYEDGSYAGVGWPTCDNTWEIQDFSLMPLPGTSGLPLQPSPSPTPSHTPVPTPTPTPKPGIMVR